TKFFRALRSAQRDIDLRPDRYTHYYTREFPVRWHAVMDTRRWGPGERLVFEPYTREVFDETFRWIADHGIFPETGMGSCQYESSIAKVACGMDQLIDVAGRVAARLKARGETIAVAESSTGGLISAALLAVPGASAYFLGGAVVYTRQ